MTDELAYQFAETEQEYEGMRVVRQLVFVEEQGIPENLVFGGNPRDDDNLAVVLNGESVIGTARIIFVSHDAAKIERMAVLDKYRNYGVGRGLMEFMVSEIKKRGYSRVFLHAQNSAVGFYRSCGFRDTGEPFMEAGIEHVKMELNLIDNMSSDKSYLLENP